MFGIKTKLRELKSDIGDLRRYGYGSVKKKHERKTYHKTPELNVIQKVHIVNEQELKQQSKQTFKNNYKVSIITPLYNTPRQFLEELLTSLKDQTYANWELCLADGSDADHKYVGEICKEWQRKDARIVYEVLKENKGISENTNECLKLATGDYIGLLDHDDVLHPSAIFEMVKAMNESEADFLYSDEVKYSGDICKISDPLAFNLKPGFGKDDLRSHNYICHFTVFSKKLLKTQKEFYRKEYDGSQDHDMVLRLTEKAEKIVHVPKVLYYWRMHNNSVAQNLDSKSYAVDAAIRAVSGQIAREHESGKVESSLPFRTIYKVDYNIIGTPLVSIVMHNCKSEKEIEYTVERILEITDYKNIEIIYLFDKTCKTIRIKPENKGKVKWIDCKNYSDAEEWNLGVQNAHGEYIALMDAKCCPANSRWLDEMLMFAQREDVVTVGPKIYYRDRSVAYAGIALSKKKKSGLYWLCQYNTIDEIGYEGMLCYARDTSAGTAACMMFKKKDWGKNYKFDSDMGKFADIDFCLKGSCNNKWNVWTSYSEILYTGENLIPETSDSEIDKFKDKWKEEIIKETYSHPMWEKLGLV